MNINLHIERLVLDGIVIESSQHQLLQRIVASELTRLLYSGGVSSSLAQSVALPRLSAEGIQLTDNKPAKVGQQIAQSVYGGLSRE